MRGKHEKPTYLTINLKYQGNFKTTRIYHYYIDKILNIFNNENCFSLEDLTKEQKSFIVKYVQNLLNKKEEINILDNWNFHINEMIFEDIYKTIKTNNREQKSFEF